MKLKLMPEVDWDGFAQACARDAHENYFQHRRGTWVFEDMGVTVLFDNNPYVKGWHFRDEETAELKEELQKIGIATLAYATWPPEGEEGAGYSYALVLDCLWDRAREVDDIQHKAFMRSWERLSAAG
jgi:hypothetical protein